MAGLHWFKHFEKMRDFRDWLIFTVPFGYSHISRFKNCKGWAQFFFKYIVPSLLIILLFGKTTPINFILSLAYVYGIYEYGYIQNDCETIKKESNPTLRVTKQQLSFYNGHRVQIYILRTIVLVVISLLLVSVCNIKWQLLVFATLILPVFFVYNKIRSHWNLELHIVLMLLRYYAFIAIAMNSFRWDLVLLTLFIYPITVYIQLSVKGKFGWKNKIYQRFLISDYSKIHPFRVKYYSFFSILLLLFWYIADINIKYSLPYLYFAIYSSIVATEKHL